MMENAQRASNFLKAISHEGRRLMILCHLASGEKSVTELGRTALGASGSRVAAIVPASA